MSASYNVTCAKTGISARLNVERGIVTHALSINGVKVYAETMRKHELRERTKYMQRVIDACAVALDNPFEDKSEAFTSKDNNDAARGFLQYVEDQMMAKLPPAKGKKAPKTAKKARVLQAV